MHRDLKELLRTAESESHRVVVVFLDVRGFSTFAKVAESSDSAEFLKSVYLDILENYFAEASFFKPTGDGLLILLEYNRATLKDVVGRAVEQSMRLVEDFALMTVGDDMINFDVPKDLGIGLARGGATALVSGGKVLDYSGRPLNLASRLMDIARPSGVVFDSTLGLNLLDSEVVERFVEEPVFIKGLAEDESMLVYCLADRVVVPAFNKRPLTNFVNKAERPVTMPFREFERRDWHLHRLTNVPVRPDDIKVYIVRPNVLASGRRHPKTSRTTTRKATLVERAGARYAQVDYQSIAEGFRKEGVKPAWPVTVTIEYAVAASVADGPPGSGPGGLPR